jgi:hypothetical protein
MMELFQEHDVEFISSTEKFDTSTPMGRAMLNICIVFAQLERETIQKRVTDAYYARSARGYSMGGPVPYGFHMEPIVMDGVRTKRYVENPGDIDHVRLLFDMYAQPSVSLGDIARRFAELGIRLFDSPLQRQTIAKMLRNPVYVQADMDVYEFFKSQGAVIVNDPANFTGTNGCYLYQGRGEEKRKSDTFAGQMLVIAPHEGVIPSDVWLQCRRKIIGNKSWQSARKSVQTWLAGKIKCGRCGYALSSHNGYFRCKKRASDRSCEGTGKLKTDEMEAFVCSEMAKRLSDFHTLARRNEPMGNPKATALKVELAGVETEIEKLLASLLGASEILISYANTKIAELDARRQSLVKQLADFAAKEVSPERMLRTSTLLHDWESAGFEDKREVVDSLITRILATRDHVEIEWKI